MRKSFYLLVSTAAVLLLAGRAWADQDHTRLLQLYVIDGGWIVWFLLVPISIVTVVLVIGHLLTIRASTLLPEMEQNQLAALLSNGQDKQALEF